MEKHECIRTAKRCYLRLRKKSPNFIARPVGFRASDNVWARISGLRFVYEGSPTVTEQCPRRACFLYEENISAQRHVILGFAVIRYRLEGPSAVDPSGAEEKPYLIKRPLPPLQ